MINGVFYKLDDYSFNWRLEDRSTLSEKVWVVAKAIFTLGGSIFAERHAAVCKEHPDAWGDKTLSYVENCPVLGGVVALIAEPLIWLWGTVPIVKKDAEERRIELTRLIAEENAGIDLEATAELSEEAFTELKNSLEALKAHLGDMEVPWDDFALWEPLLEQLKPQVFVTQSADRLRYACSISECFLSVNSRRSSSDLDACGNSYWSSGLCPNSVMSLHTCIKKVAESRLELLALA